LQRRTLRVVDPNTFAEDSLRVLPRAAICGALFELTIDPNTVANLLIAIATRRPAGPSASGGEFRKAAAPGRSGRRSASRSARALGVIQSGCFRKWKALYDCPTGSEWHP
jgi:hypothetical protein